MRELPCFVDFRDYDELVRDGRDWGKVPIYVFVKEGGSNLIPEVGIKMFLSVREAFSKPKGDGDSLWMISGDIGRTPFRVVWQTNIPMGTMYVMLDDQELKRYGTVMNAIPFQDAGRFGESFLEEFREGLDEDVTNFLFRPTYLSTGKMERIVLPVEYHGEIPAGSNSPYAYWLYGEVGSEKFFALFDLRNNMGTIRVNMPDEEFDRYFKHW